MNPVESQIQLLADITGAKTIGNVYSSGEQNGVVLMEQAQAAQQARGPEFEKLPLKERLRIAREDAAKARKKLKDERLKGTMYEPRKKNPGGRSTRPKR